LTTTPHSRILRWLANATLVYPLVSIGLMYGYWSLAWLEVGHKPIPFEDDLPIGGYGYGFMFVQLIVGRILLPMAICLNLAYAIKVRHSAAQAGIRALTLISFWLGWFMWILNDPHAVVEWFVD
jgi:hypothetical protein